MIAGRADDRAGPKEEDLWMYSKEETERESRREQVKKEGSGPHIDIDLESVLNKKNKF